MAQRPMRKACLLPSAAAPLISMARRSASSDEGDEAGLPGGAEHQHVGVDGVAEELFGEAGGVEDAEGVVAEAGAQREGEAVGGEVEAAVAGEVAGDDLVGVEDGAGAAAGHEAEGLGAGGGDEVAADQRVGLADGDADGGDGGGGLGDAAVDVDRAALLGEAGHLHLAGALALEVGGHGDQRADGDDAGAADAGDEDVVGAADRRERGLGDVGEDELGLLRLLHLGAFEGDEAGAEAVEAGEVLVAARLVDRALAAELGLERQDGDAVRLHAAVAAAFADVGVDEDAAVGVGELAALAAAALLGGAGLDVDDGGDAGDLLQLALDGVELAALAHFDPRGEGFEVDLFLGVVDADDVLDAHGEEFVGDLLGGEAALVGLAAGHGDGVVEEDLVGDVDAAGEGGADRLHAGVVVGAVAEVLEDVRGGWRRAPRRSSWRPRRPCG